MKFTYFPASHACLRMLHTRHPDGAANATDATVAGVPPPCRYLDAACATVGFAL